MLEFKTPKHNTTIGEKIKPAEIEKARDVMSNSDRQFNRVPTHACLLTVANPLWIISEHSTTISTTNFLLPNIKLISPPFGAKHKTMINRLLQPDLHQCASYTPIESREGGAFCDRLLAQRRSLTFFYFFATVYCSQ